MSSFKFVFISILLISYSSWVLAGEKSYSDGIHTFWSISYEKNKVKPCEEVKIKPSEYFLEISKKHKCKARIGENADVDAFKFECDRGSIGHNIYFNQEHCQFNAELISLYMNGHQKKAQKLKSKKSKKETVAMIAPKNISQKQDWLDFYAGCIKNATKSLDPTNIDQKLDIAYANCRCVSDSISNPKSDLRMKYEKIQNDSSKVQKLILEHSIDCLKKLGY